MGRLEKSSTAASTSGGVIAQAYWSSRSILSRRSSYPWSEYPPSPNALTIRRCLSQAGGAAVAARTARPGNSWGCPRGHRRTGWRKGLVFQGQQLDVLAREGFLQLSPMGAQGAGVAAFTAHGGLDLAAGDSSTAKTSWFGRPP